LVGAGAAVDLKLMRAAALLDKDPVAAAREASEILNAHPGHPAATLLLATAQRSCGDSQAATSFAELAAAQPDSALMQLELGRTHAAQARHASALAALKSAVKLEPNLAEAWRELATLYANAGDTAACDAAYARFEQLAHPDRHLAEAGMALSNLRFDAAESLLRRQLAQAPQDAPAIRMLAQIAGEREDYLGAERLLNECLKVAPGYSRARFDLARTLYARHQAYPVLPLVERLLVQDPGNLRYRSLLASAYGMLGQHDRATQIASALTTEFPQDEAVWLSCGHSLRIAGRPDEAIQAYRKSTELRPDYGEAWYSLANLKTFRFAPQDLQVMQAQIARPELPDADRLQFEFALGKALEDAGNLGESFEHYVRGNVLRRAVVVYDAAANAAYVQRSQRLYTREFFAARAGVGCQARDPIFIVGLPRAGSTLLEQILASHSQVEGTRELADITGLAMELGAREVPGEPPSYPQSVARLTHAQLKQLGERYLNQTRPTRHLGRPLFIDKMGSNFAHLGLIQLILPNARIIDARRSPLACCFANFKQHFQQGAWFAYSLEDLAHYYREYVRLMGHFDSALPGRVHRVYYEHLVADLEGEVRRLLEYCGLPFEEACLRFHETQRVVHTASSEQVRQPLYTDGVDQWRKYEPWLDKLKQDLGDLVSQYPEPPAQLSTDKLEQG
jgi:tetratricopeptide (TPR) repeat protein